MKISYSNYPILEKLEKCFLGNIPLFEIDFMFFKVNNAFFTHHWKRCNTNFKSEINVISTTFDEASMKASDQLYGILGDILNNDLSDFSVSGCYLVGDFVYMIDYETKKGSQDQEISFYMFDKKGIPLCMFIDSAKHKIYQNGWISNCFELKNDKTLIQAWIYKKFLDIVIYNMFKNYAQVETKILLANSKQKIIDCKYVNNTKFNLTYLDSKWFTDLVKSEGFNVRGHFRLQPKKKDGIWTKELIWISDFKKQGYISRAKVLLQNSL